MVSSFWVNMWMSFKRLKNKKFQGWSSFYSLSFERKKERNLNTSPQKKVENSSLRHEQSLFFFFFFLPLALEDPTTSSRERTKTATLVDSMATFRLEMCSSDLQSPPQLIKCSRLPAASRQSSSTTCHKCPATSWPLVDFTTSDWKICWGKKAEKITGLNCYRKINNANPVNSIWQIV